MNKKPLVSIIMSVYNEEERVKNCINSILNQDYKNFEFLIVDDFSEDNTLEVLNKFSREDSRIKIFKNKSNLGLTKNLNFLIKKSSGDFVARQDADDTSKQDRIKKQINTFQSLDLDVVGSRAIVEQTGKTIPSLSYYLPLKISMLYKNPFIHGTLVFKKRILEKVNFYNEDFYYSQDYKIMSDILKLSNKIKILNEPLYVLNTKNNLSSNHAEKQKYFANCVRKNLIP